MEKLILVIENVKKLFGSSSGLVWSIVFLVDIIHHLVKREKEIRMPDPTTNLNRIEAFEKPLHDITIDFYIYIYLRYQTL